MEQPTSTPNGHPAFGVATSEAGMPTLVLFTHANLKTKTYVIKQLVTGFYRSEAQKCTYLVTTSNTIFPVQESVEEVIKKIGYKVEGEANG